MTTAVGVALNASPPVRQTAASALPPLVVDALPPPVRSELQRAHDDARTRPRDPAVVGRLAMLLHAYEQYQSADACYRIARQLDSRVLSWAYLSGVVQSELGEHTSARASFQQAVRIEPDYLPARMRLADALMKAGDLDASRAAYAALVHDFPELALAHYGLGRVSAALDDVAAAAEHYRRAVDAAPQFGPAHYALALAYRDLGRRDRTDSHLDAYRRVGAHRPVLPDRLLEDVRLMRETARDLIAEAARAGRSGRIEESIALHLRALDADPKAAQAHVNLISLYGRTDRADKAEQHYRAAIALQGSLADAHYNYGVLLAARGDEAAADAFRKALAVNPFHAQAHNNLGALLARAGDLSAAAGHYQQALASDPQHRTARFNLGRLLLVTGRPRDAATQLLRILVPEDSETPRYMLVLSSALSAAGDSANARLYGERALKRAKLLGQTDLARRIEKELRRLPPLSGR